MSPADFWRMTARELLHYVDGWNAQQRDVLRRFAWQASIIIGPWCGRNTPTPAELLGETNATPVELFSTPEELREYMRKRAEEADE